MNIKNRKAFFDYDLVERIEAGVALVGAEVKSLREGHASLDGAFVKIIGSEAFLIGAQIFPYAFSRPDGYDPKRTRKLLLHKKELLKIQQKMDAGSLTVVPVSWYTKGSRMKLEIAIARGKKQFEKREKIKRHDMKIELERNFRGKIK